MAGKTGFIRQDDGSWQVVLKEPTAAARAKAVATGAKRAYEAFIDACFMAEQLADLYLPALRYPYDGSYDARSRYYEKSGARQDKSDELCKKDNPVHLDFAIQVAEQVVTDLKAARAAVDAKPKAAPRKRTAPRRRVRTA